MKSSSPERLTPEIRKGSEDGIFHFEQISELEPAVISLTEKLKEKIESGRYDTLISDEIGGRIPTLILRKIIKRVRPDSNPETYFISSGQTYLRAKETEEKGSRYDKSLEHIKKITRGAANALVVTQFVFQGGTVSKLYRLLEQAGVKNVDVATLRYSFLDEISFPKENLYTGTRDGSHKIDENHYNFFGVRKPNTAFSPHPLHITKVIKDEGRELSQQEWLEIFRIEKSDYGEEVIKKTNDPERNSEWERRMHAPLSQEEKESIQKDINLARKDIDLLAEKVVEKVWGKQEERAAA